MIVAIIILIICLCFGLIGCDKKNSKEEICYEIIIEASYQFKNPSSVRVISGTLSTSLSEMDFYTAYLCISATNGYGATITGYYQCTYLKSDNIVLLDEIDDETDPNYYSKLLQCKSRDDFDIDKVNKKLDKKWNK